jgi:hypothetical protein
MLAPFVSRTNSPLYNPYNGDYPNVFGDQTLWFVYNDKGNIHTETQGVPIGLELRTQAFAFVTNNEVNNMTFYNTEIINHGDPVSDCYFGQWVDPDLGNYSDDYVGCDTLLGLGYCYNGDEEDEGILGYGLNPPTVGVDFFQGPKNDSGRVLGMSKFVYYNNDFSNIGNPFRPQHYYNFLRGLWHDGSPMTDDNKNGTTGTNKTNFMFPGDPCRQIGWTEKSAGNVPADRRFLQSSGPFSLKTGARNNVTIGMVWARASTGTAACCLELLKIADIKAQVLFETGFTPNDGPNAPDVVLTELNQELVLSLENTLKTEKYNSK